MKISRADATVRRVDDAVSIVALFDGAGFSFDFVLGRIDGDHARVVNNVSDRAYFVLSGEIEVQVGDEVHGMSAHDLVLIPVGVPHKISGRGEYVVVTAPPFKPENEQIS